MIGAAGAFLTDTRWLSYKHANNEVFCCGKVTKGRVVTLI